MYTDKIYPNFYFRKKRKKGLQYVENLQTKLSLRTSWKRSVIYCKLMKSHVKLWVR